MRCKKGQQYRLRRNWYLTARGDMVFTRRMVHLKRSSCSDPDCMECMWLLDFALPEEVFVIDSMKDEKRYEKRSIDIVPKEVEGGAYRLEPIHQSDDDYRLRFVLEGERK